MNHWGWSAWLIGHIRSNCISYLILGHKRHCGFCLGHSLLLSPLLSLGETSCHVGSSPTERAICLRNWGLQPTATWGSSLGSSSSCPSQALIWQQPHETLRQNHPAKLPPVSWASDTVWDHKCLLSEVAKFGVTCYTAVANAYRL